VSASAPITVEVWDFGAGIDLAATTLEVNGVPTGATPTGDPKKVTFTYQPPARSPGSSPWA